METIEIKPWIIHYDKNSTALAYDKILAGDAERCGCEPCLNFIATRNRIFCDDVLKIFEILGVDFRKEVEVYHSFRIRPGWHSYGGWFHFVGEVGNTSEDNEAPVNKYWPVCEGLSWHFTNKRDLSNEIFGCLPLVQINFEATVPWVIDLEEPE